MEARWRLHRQKEEVMTKASRAIGASIMLLWAGTALALTPEQKCNMIRVKAWRTFRSCVDLAVAKEAAEILVTNEEVRQAFAKCRHAYFKRWYALQTPAFLGTACFGGRFTDNLDGTVTDNLTTLVWEKKTDDGSYRDKDLIYNWSGALVGHLRTINQDCSELVCPPGAVGFGGSSGWRLPTLAELHTIVLDFSCTATSCTCPSSPCIDPALDATTTRPSFHWSSTNWIQDPAHVWAVHFDAGLTAEHDKTLGEYTRAVHGGL
jgi:hypothetical protein